MLEEADGELAGLEARKAELAEERDRAIAQAKQRYADEVRDIDAELATVRRLQRALMPPEPKAPKPKPELTKTAGQWVPRPENFTHVFRALSEGAETVRDIAEVVPISSATVAIVIEHARNAGSVRLAGTVKRGTTEAKRYRLTPNGEESLRLAIENGAPVVANT